MRGRHHTLEEFPEFIQNESCYTLAEQFKKNPKTIWRIIKNKAWKEG